MLPGHASAADCTSEALVGDAAVFLKGPDSVMKKKNASETDARGLFSCKPPVDAAKNAHFQGPSGHIQRRHEGENTDTQREVGNVLREEEEEEKGEDSFGCGENTNSRGSFRKNMIKIITIIMIKKRELKSERKKTFGSGVWAISSEQS